MSIERGPIVAKFGGSSLGDGERIKHVAEIVRGDTDRRYVVVSAPGRRFPEDEKITTILYECAQLRKDGLPFDKAFSRITQRYEEIGRSLSIHPSVVSWLVAVEDGIQQGNGKEWAGSRGEWLSAKIFSCYLGGSFVDARNLILLKQAGLVDPLTYQAIKEQLTQDTVYIIPGFYGVTQDASLPEGILCFARGGSDITGAIIARGVGARVYENWTDVDGVKAADPKIIPHAKVINEMSYGEMRELGYRGADVLHMDAILPAYELGIPINVRNTLNPSTPGTMIIPERKKIAGESVIGIAAKEGFISFRLTQAGMNTPKGIARKILEIFEKNDISVDHFPTGLDGMSVIFDKEQLNGKKEKIMKDLDTVIHPDHVRVTEDIGIVCVVGDGIEDEATSVHARVFTKLEQEGIRTLACSYNTEGNNIVIAVSNHAVTATVKALYSALIS